VRRSVRRLLFPLAVVGLALGAGCSDDGGAEPDADARSTTTTTTTEPRPADTTFEADDVEALCADLEGLADIDPDADPTPASVERLTTIATTAPPGVAEPLRDVAAFGQAVIDGEPTEELQAAALEAATILIAYGNEACEIDVPLFDAIAGV